MGELNCIGIAPETEAGILKKGTRTVPLTLERPVSVRAKLPPRLNCESRPPPTSPSRVKLVVVKIPTERSNFREALALRKATGGLNDGVARVSCRGSFPASFAEPSELM